MTVAVKRKFYKKGAKMMENDRILVSRQFSFSFLCLILAVGSTICAYAYPAAANSSAGGGKTVFRAIEIFPLVKQHVHGSTVVELPYGDILEP